MTGHLKALVAEAETWPEEDQRELVEYAETIRARRAGIYVMTAAERDAVDEGLGQVSRGEFVSDAEMEAFWKRNGVA